MLSHEQQKFKLLLHKTPFLVDYWDFEARVCDIKRLRKAADAFSHGERIMANFYMALWLCDIDLKFDLFEAVSTLDPNQLAVIKEWLAEPFWP